MGTLSFRWDSIPTLHTYAYGLWQDGRTIAAIAAAINSAFYDQLDEPMSRNAVVGYCRRQGFPGRPSPIRRRDATHQQPPPQQAPPPAGLSTLPPLPSQIQVVDAPVRRGRPVKPALVCRPAGEPLPSRPPPERRELARSPPPPPLWRPDGSGCCFPKENGVCGKPLRSLRDPYCPECHDRTHVRVR
jgi:hypothetical protein